MVKGDEGDKQRGRHFLSHGIFLPSISKLYIWFSFCYISTEVHIFSAGRVTSLSACKSTSITENGTYSLYMILRMFTPPPFKHTRARTHTEMDLYEQHLYVALYEHTQREMDSQLHPAGAWRQAWMGMGSTHTYKTTRFSEPVGQYIDGMGLILETSCMPSSFFGTQPVSDSITHLAYLLVVVWEGPCIPVHWLNLPELG